MGLLDVNRLRQELKLTWKDIDVSIDTLKSEGLAKDICSSYGLNNTHFYVIAKDKREEFIERLAEISST
ncbi:MAG: hypothetical protein Q7S74_05470 [Nanoarchaeota archaeon]|nr:hypothetical protein [Nanoarchaeota archaeon]